MVRSITTLLLLVSSIFATELTFELPDNAAQCFYEEVKAGVDCVFEFQVVDGGQYDVDVTISDPTEKVIYNGIKKQYESHSWKTEHPGVYKACFSNEFSTISHKIIYMDWQIGDREDHKVVQNGVHAMTSVESSVVGITEKMGVVTDYQTHHRLREMSGRKRAEDLNERVMFWSLGQTAVIVMISIAQVWILKSFFSDKRPRY